MSDQENLNRHELISHFYNDNGLNEQGKNILEALHFKDWHDAFFWVKQEFINIKINWQDIGAGSPYPVSLPNVIKQIEENVGMMLEDELKTNWKHLTEIERSNAEYNFKKIFGSPELIQGQNRDYCKQKYTNWLAFTQGVSIKQSENSNFDVMFIPKHLEIENKPALNNFPLNILFSSTLMGSDGTQSVRATEYIPDISSFVDDGKVQKLKYLNKEDRSGKFWAEVIYDTVTGSYSGAKYIGEAQIGRAVGNNWKSFFTHFSSLGVAVENKKVN